MVGSRRKDEEGRKTLFFVLPVLLLPVTFEGISALIVSFSYPLRLPSPSALCFAMFDLMLSLIDGTR